jgi:hypothetical protein
MTIINTYGINAGRSIAREIDDDSDKSRREAKRRADAAYFADKERLHARVRQMNEQAAQVSADHFTALLQEQRADTQFRITDRRTPITPTEGTDEPLENPQALLSAEANAAAIAQPLGRDSRATRSDSQQPSDQDKSRLSAIGSGSLVSQAEIDAVAINELHDNAYGTTKACAEDLLDHLLADVNGSPLNLTREGVMLVLERLSQDLKARPSREVTLKEKDGVLGYLEFLEGYFEKSQTTSGPSHEIVLLMENIRAQLGAVTDPMLAVGMQNLVVASQADSTTQLLAINREQRKKQAKSNSVSAEEAQRSDLDSYASVAMMNSVDASLSPASKKESSQSKDSQRRRDETLVSVTLRSV